MRLASMPSRWRRMRAARLTKAEQRDPFLALGGEDQPEQLLEQVAAVERLVERLEGGELLLLPVGQVLGVLQQREASPVDDLRRVLLAALPRGVPDAAPRLRQAAASALTWVSIAIRSGPSSSTHAAMVFLSRPSRAQTIRPDP